MNFNQITENYAKLKSPVSDFSMHGSTNQSFNDFMSLLKTEDIKSKRILKRFYIIYIVMAILYFFLFIVNPDPDLLLKYRISGSSYIIAFSILIWLFRDKYLKLNKINYLASPKQFLNEAKTRFSFWSIKLFRLIPVLILIDIGATISLTKYIKADNIITEILLIQLALVIVFLVSFYFGRLDWRKKKKPIFQKIVNILSEFET